MKLAEEVKESVKEEQKEEIREEQVENVSSEESSKEEKPEVKQKKEKKDKLKEQIAQLEAELAKQHNEYLKVYAEMENTKRRVKEESIKDRKYASQKVISELINPIDMLVQIVQSEAPSAEVANYLIGFKMIANQLVEIMKNEGLQEIDALHKEFDPSCMQAMSVENTDEVEENTVVKVMQTGYLYKDRLLRPAMVVVSKKIEEEKKEENE